MQVYRIKKSYQKHCNLHDIKSDCYFNQFRVENSDVDPYLIVSKINTLKLSEFKIKYYEQTIRLKTK